MNNLVKFAFMVFAMLILNQKLSAQHPFYAQSLQVRTQNPSTCTPVQIEVTSILSCSNYTVAPNSTVFVNNNNLVVIEIHATSAAACLTTNLQEKRTASFAVNNTGVYTIRVNAFLDGVLVNTIYGNVTVAPCTTTEIVNQLNNSPVCEGGQSIFKIIANNAQSYQWQYSLDGQIWKNVEDNYYYSGANAPKLKINHINTNFNNFVYRCIAIGNSQSSDTSSIEKVIVNKLPVIDLSTATTALCPGSSTTISSIVNNTVVNYQWFMNNNLVQHAVEDSYVATQAAIYSLRVIDVSGCVNEQTLEISADLCLGNQELNSIQPKIKVYPNPVQDVLIIQSEKNLALNLRLLNSAGQVILEKYTTAYNTEVDLKGLAAGLYLLQYRDNHQLKTIKLIKQ